MCMQEMADSIFPGDLTLLYNDGTSFLFFFFICLFDFYKNFYSGLRPKIIVNLQCVLVVYEK